MDILKAIFDFLYSFRNALFYEYSFGTVQNTTTKKFVLNINSNETSLSDLPSDIIFEICSYLPPLSLIRFASSCRTLWDLRIKAFHKKEEAWDYQNCGAIKKWTQGVSLAISNEDLEGLEFFLRKSSSLEDYNTIRWNGNFYRAALTGRRDVVDMLMEYNHGIEWSLGLRGAARGGHKHLVDFFAQNTTHAYDSLWEEALEESASGGHIQLVQYCMEKGGKDVEKAVACAACEGHFGVVKFLLPLVPCRVLQLAVNYCATRAAAFLDKDMLEYLVQLGANDWKGCLYDCVRYDLTPKRLELIEYLIAKGANDWNGALRLSIAERSQALMELFLNKGADCLDECIEAAKEAEEKDPKRFIGDFNYKELCDFKQHYETRKKLNKEM